MIRYGTDLGVESLFGELGGLHINNLWIFFIVHELFFGCSRLANCPLLVFLFKFSAHGSPLPPLVTLSAEAFLSVNFVMLYGNSLANCSDCLLFSIFIDSFFLQ